MNIIGRRKIWYLISILLILPGVLSLIFWGLKTGIDFRGGTLLEIQFKDQKSATDIRSNLDSLDGQPFKNANIQPSGDGIIIRTEEMTEENQKKLTEALSRVGEYQQNRLETVGPTVSADLKRKAIISVILATLVIIVYIAIAFRKVPKPANSWRFGICAVLALIHDILFVVGVFAILGHFFGYEVDSLFITALLTIMGFSVHDTIVVFDRIRENLRKSPSLNLPDGKAGFEMNVNNSILQTLNRSLNTSFTVIIVLLSLYLLGGETLKHFILALLIGIAIGTYSSIFNASPLLVTWSAWARRRETGRTGQ
ncbi:MAG TPA: protein translocase subunit SecF [Patescibacteria group bacterium]|nr:protein translocase subunit SecF [Patescibacteria group bacterium]